MTARRLGAVAALCLAAACSSGSTPKAVDSPAPPSPSPSPIVEPSPTPSPSPTASPAATGTATAGASTVCRSAQLRLGIANSEGGAGQVTQDLVLTNKGAPCSLHGFPGVSFLDSAGRQIGDPAALNRATPVRRVQLASGGSARALLRYSNAGAYPEQKCRPKQASTVRVYPPGERAALTAPDPVQVCSGSGVDQLHIDPVMPG